MHVAATTSNGEKSVSAHISATLKLGVPLIAAQLVQMSINVTDTVMLGWLGTSELAAGTLAFQAFFIFLIFGLGFGAAIVPLLASALGSGDEVGVRRSARMGLWALAGIALLFQIPLSMTDEILLALNQKPELADLAQRYMNYAQWSLIPIFILIGLRAFLTGLELVNAVLLVTLAIAVLNAVLNYALIFGNFGMPRLEMEGAGIATVVANCIGAVVVVIYVLWAPAARRFEVFVRLWRPDWGALARITSLGVPISLTILAEAGMFSAASVMIGWLGVEQLAAHGIALQIASIAFMVPLGLSQASSVRVGNAYGRANSIDIGRAGNTALVMAVVFSALSALVFIIFPDRLAALFLDDANADAQVIVRAAVPLLWMAAAFQLADCVQAISAGNLRGLQDTRVPMILASVSYWLVGLPAGYVLAFVFDLGAVGVWAGMAAGLTGAAVALTHRFSRQSRIG